MNKKIKKVMICFLTISILFSTSMLCFKHFSKSMQNFNKSKFYWPCIDEHQFDNYINSYAGSYNFESVKANFKKQISESIKKQGFNPDNIKLISKNSNRKISLEVNLLSYNKKYFFNLIDKFV